MSQLYSSHFDSQLEVNIAVVLVAVESVLSSFPAKVVAWFFSVSLYRVIVLGSSPTWTCERLPRRPQYLCPPFLLIFLSFDVYYVCIPDQKLYNYLMLLYGTPNIWHLLIFRKISDCLGSVLEGSG